MKKLFTKSRIIFMSVFLFILALIFVVSIVSPYENYVILTNSMTPVIDPGDLLVIDKRIDVDELKVGQIIGFKATIGDSVDKKVVFHYIHSIEFDESNSIIIKTIPAISNVPDTWEIYEEDLVGTYVFHLPKIGKFIHFLKSPFGIIFMFGNVIVVFTLYNIIFKAKNAKTKKVESEVVNK